MAERTDVAAVIQGLVEEVEAKDAEIKWLRELLEECACYIHDDCRLHSAGGDFGPDELAGCLNDLCNRMGAALRPTEAEENAKNPA